jgi:hypothetical protein
MSNFDYEDTNEPYSNPNVNDFEDYTEDDLTHIFHQGDFHGWDDVIDWLHNYGGEDNFLHPGKVKNIHDDLVRLRDANEEFTNDPHNVYVMAKGYREA